MGKQDRYTEAEEAHRAGLLRAKYPEDKRKTWFNLGDALCKQRRYTEAEEAYKKALGIDNKDAIAWYNLSAALYEQGRYTEAEDACRKSVAINPEYANAKKLLCK